MRKPTHIVHYKRIKSQLTKWEKIFSVHVSDKGLLYNICKELLQINIKKKGNPVDKLAKYLNRDFTKEVIQMTNRHMKISSSSLGIRFNAS